MFFGVGRRHFACHVRTDKGHSRFRAKNLIVENLECRRLLDGHGLAADEPFPDFGSVQGVKWEDIDGDGIRDRNEPGLGGVTIYADLNGSGVRDRGEPFSETSHGGPDFADVGFYFLGELPVGEYAIHEQVPRDFEQTFPRGFIDPPFEGDDDEFSSTFPEFLELHLGAGEIAVETVGIQIHPFCFVPIDIDVIVSDPDVEFLNQSGIQLNGCGGEETLFEVSIFGNGRVQQFEIQFVDANSKGVIDQIPVAINTEGPGGGHWIQMEPQSALEGIDFGNRRMGREMGFIDGRKWNDANANGMLDGNETGLGGVTIYLDQNGNGRYDRREPLTVTSFDDPFTDFDEGGLYSFGVPGGDYIVREIVPEGYQQTSPGAAAAVVSSETGRFEDGVAIDFDVTGVKFTRNEDGEGGTALDLTVVWPDSCGSILHEQTSFTVIGDHILVDMHGHQTGDFCAEVISPETQTIEIVGINRVNHTVVATLHEQLRQVESEVATLGVVGEIRLEGEGQHVITVNAGQSVSEIDFGNHQTGPDGAIHGTKWHDLNGNGARDNDEPGLAGVTIYLDLNQNGRIDDGEPAAESMVDDPDTRADESGHYWIENVAPGRYFVGEVVPDGFTQTFPFDFVADPLPEIGPDAGGPWHFIQIAPGQNVDDIDFGNRSNEPGSIHGLKWLDENGNGRFDADEAGLPGVTIYVDLNFNGAFDEGEPHAVTMEENPDTDFDEGGRYWMEGIDPGHYQVHEVIPEGFVQTFPSSDFLFDIPFLEFPFFPFPAPHFVNVQPGTATEEINFGNQKGQPGSIHGMKWNDQNGNGRQDENETGVAGVTIFLDMNLNGEHDADEPSTVTMQDDPDTQIDETGHYWFEEVEIGFYSVGELIPENFEQTYPAGFGFPLPFFDIEPVDPLVMEGQHSIFVNSGQEVVGLDFGNREILPPAVIAGVKWMDSDGNAERDDDEPGIPGVTIFSDLNLNGQFDRGEPFAVTQEDNPRTRGIDEAGMYQMELSPGMHLIEEVVPAGFEQIHPSPFRRVRFPFNLGHAMELEPQEELRDVDFGNRQLDFDAAVQGVNWEDFDGDHRRSDNERGLPGVVMFADLNLNGELEPDEPQTVSSRDDPNTRFDETGTYRLELPVGDHLILQVLPKGYEQIEPSPLREIIFPFNLGHSVTLEQKGQVVNGIDFGNRPFELPEPGAIGGRVAFDVNDSPGAPGIAVYLDTNNNGVLDRGEPFQRTQSDNPNTRLDEAGRYEFQDVRPGTYRVRMDLPEGVIQTFPIGEIFLQDNGETTKLPGGQMISFGLGNIGLVRSEQGETEIELTFEGVWPNGCGVLVEDDTTVSVDGSDIHINVFATNDGEICNLALKELSQTIHVSLGDENSYWVGGILHEYLPDGDVIESFVVEEKFLVANDPTHSVRVREGQVVDDVDFAIIEVPDGEFETGDFNHDNRIDDLDIDTLAAAVNGNATDSIYDLNEDGSVDREDMNHLVLQVLESTYGDSNLDGRFDSTDIVQVFQAGEYEDEIQNNSGWKEGDWNGDGEFDTADLVLAFQHGDYLNAALSSRAMAAAAVDSIWSAASNKGMRRSF